MVISELIMLIDNARSCVSSLTTFNKEIQTRNLTLFKGIKVIREVTEYQQLTFEESFGVSRRGERELMFISICSVSLS